MAHSKRTLEIEQPSMFSLEDGPAKTSPWLATVLAWLDQGPDFSTNSLASLARSLPLGWWQKMSPDSCRPVVILRAPEVASNRTEAIWAPSSGRWLNSGMGTPGGCLMHNSSESLNCAVASSLSGILEPWSAPAEVLFEPEGSSGAPASSGPGDDAGAANGAGSSREVVAALTSNGVGTCGADDNQAQAGHLVVGSRFGSELARPLTAAVNGPHYDYDTENFVISDGVRRLTPIECERLQGFPDDWTLPLHDSPRYRVLGNAVAVPVVQWRG